MASVATSRKKTSSKEMKTKLPVDFLSTFAALKNVLKPYEKKCDVKEDTVGGYHLYTKKKIHRGQPVYFAGIKLNKNYVSFYLMTVYGSPEERRQIPPELKKRMQGKACFNFTSPDPALMTELANLVKSGAKKFLEVDQLDVTGMKCD